MTTIEVRNLPADAKEKSLQQVFARFGQVTSVKLGGEHRLRAKKSGFVEMPKAEDADHAIRRLDGQYFRGSFLRVQKLVN